MRLDPKIQPRRATASGLQRRRVVGVAAAGAVIFSGLAVPPASAASLAPGALAGMLPAALPAGPAGVGPVDPDNGYPYWYGDAGNAGQGLDPVRLELCVDVNVCAGAIPEDPAEAGYDTSEPLSIPENFPEEAFWWSGETALTLSDGSEARVVMAQEAAFGGDGSVAAGQQNAFARLRIRIEGAVPGAQYRVTHPYGQDILFAEPDRDRLRFTEDIGCLQQPCTWEEPAEGRVGPFLRWDDTLPAPDPGTIGDPAIPHTVVGSPHGTNFVNIEILQEDGTYVSLGETDQFNVMGKIATLQVDVDQPGGLFNEAVDVNIQSSFPTESKIVYTINDDDPAVDAEGNVINGTVFETTDPRGAALVNLATPGTNTLKYMAVSTAPLAEGATAETTPVSTEVYELDASTPWIDASPDGSATSYAGPQSVTLTGTTSSTDSPSTVLYTTDGSEPQYTAEGEPTGTTRVYSGPITVGVSGAIKAVTLETLPPAVEGGPTTLNPGEVRTFDYTIHNLQAVGATGEHGFPVTLTDNGFGDQDPVTLDLCMDDPLCPNMDVLPFPNEPVSWPDNFPGEAFWWAADAEMTVEGEEVRLVLASEAAFSVDEVREGDQVAFGRIRVRGDDVFEVGATYKVTHPYGTVLLTADDTGSLNYTEDLGAMNASGDFSPLLEAKIGPFLRWDAGAPAGYLGDGATPHAVVGSPYNTNFFQLEKVANAAGTPDSQMLGTTDQFVVQGRTVGATPPEETVDTTAPAVTASPAGGPISDTANVTLASEEGAAIFFTLDGTPATAASIPYLDPIQVSAGQTLSAVAVDAAGNVSDLGTWVFTAATVAEPPAEEEPPVEEPPAEEEPPVEEPGTAPGSGDFNNDGNPDVVAADESGTLWLYAGNGADGLQPSVQIGTGWNTMSELFGAGDFNSDGDNDVIARDRSGRLWLYAGNGADGLQPRVQIGTGWNTMSELFGAGDFNSDGDNDVIARDRSGRLWLYAGNGADGLQPRVQIGTGWNTMSGLFGAGDFNSDGDNDVIARDRSGRLWLYAGNGADGLQPRVQIGTGWNTMSGLFGAGDFNSDGDNDVIARDRSGRLWLYAGNGADGLQPRVQIGTGWNTMSGLM